MSLSKELVEKFQAVILDHYKEMMSYTTAESELKGLAELIRLTAAPKGTKEDV